MLRDRCVYMSVQLKLLAKTLVEHAGGNEAAHSAQANPFADGITRPRRLRGQCVPNRFRHLARIVSAFDVLESCGSQTLSFIRVNIESDLCGFRVSVKFGFRVGGLNQQCTQTESPDLVVQCFGISLYCMFARSVNSH